MHEDRRTRHRWSRGGSRAPATVGTMVAALGWVLLAGCEGAALAGAADAGPREAPGIDAAAGPDGCIPHEGFVDLDGDGYGDPDQRLSWCGPTPPQASTDDGDCDDACPTCHPLAPERCDTIDNDCDSLVDEEVEDGAYFRDADGDGFGDPDRHVMDCSQPEGYVERDGDCDDGAATVNPGRVETCDLVDQDCDGALDEGALALAGEPVELGGLADGAPNLAATSIGDELAVVWVDDGHVLMAQRAREDGTLLAEPLVVAPLDTDEPAAPKATLFVDDAERTHLVVMWSGRNALWVRSVGLQGAAASEPPRRLDRAASARGIGLVRLSDAVGAVWQRGANVFFEELAPDSARSLSSPAVLLRTPAAGADASSASVATLDPAGEILLGVIERETGVPGSHAFVHRIVVRPDVIDDRSVARLPLPEGASPRTIRLVVDPQGDPRELSALVFVGSGQASEQSTQAFRLRPSAPGAPDSVQPLGEPIPGMVVGAALAPGGADAWLQRSEPQGKETIQLHHQPLTLGRTDEVGASHRLELNVDAAGARSGRTGLLAFGGSFAPSAVSGRLWLQSYGCALTPPD